MKVTVNIDCTPEEARAFFGLPDVRPMQDALMQEMQEKLREAAKSMEPAELLQSWLPGGMGWEQMQKLWNGMSGAMGGAAMGGFTGDRESKK